MRSLHHLHAAPTPQVQPDVVSASGAVLRDELGLDAALLAPHGLQLQLSAASASGIRETATLASGNSRRRTAARAGAARHSQHTPRVADAPSNRESLTADSTG